MNDKENANVAKDSLPNGYRQLYVIKHNKDDDLDGKREVFFQCGNWCYDGTIQFQFLHGGRVMSLEDIPKIAPALQKQQDDLSFVCNSSR